MELLDAIKKAILSKTRIRRESWEEGVYKEVCRDSPSQSTVYTAEEILADDWAVEEMALKLCPFCGEAVYIEIISDSYKNTTYYITHYNDIGQKKLNCLSTMEGYDKAMVIENWNTRTGEK